MAKMLMKNGNFEGEYWRLEGDRLSNGFYKVKELPLCELSCLNKRQEIDNLFYVKFEFNNGITFTASMDSTLYDELYDAFQTCKNMPHDEAVASDNPFNKHYALQKEDWKKGKVEAQLSQQNILQVFGLVVFLAIFLYGINTADLDRAATLTYQRACINDIHSLTGYDKTRLIGEGKQIEYEALNGETTLFRCHDDKAQFYVEATGQWVNLKI